MSCYWHHLLLLLFGVNIHLGGVKTVISIVTITTALIIVIILNYIVNHVDDSPVYEEYVNIKKRIKYGIEDFISEIKFIFEKDTDYIEVIYNGEKQYRIHVDECIYCLWDLQNNNYDSVFDEPLFAEYKRIHDLYGTVFVLSLHFTQLNDIAWGAPFPPEMIEWDLSQMPDKWKREFEENSDWLKFSYHTYAYEYKYTTSDKIAERDWEQDIIDMEKEVVRFAGADSWNSMYVKTHGVCGDENLIEIFKRHGAKYFEGDAEHVEKMDSSMQSYYLTDEQQNWMFKNGGYYDDSNGALFLPGAGNIERIYGFIPGGDRYKVSMSMDEYMGKFVYASDYFVHQSCDYLSFCSHESPMLNGIVILCDNVAYGDYIELNGHKYVAGVDFEIGKTDNKTMSNLYGSLENDVVKFRLDRNLATIYAEYGECSDSFEIKTAFGEIEKLAKWCYENGWRSKHLENDSVFEIGEPIGKR